MAASLALLATPAAAQSAGEGGSVNLLEPNAGLMFWTLIIFGLVFFTLKRFAFGPLTEAVERREQALRDALEAAKQDRAEAARVLSEHKAQLEQARGEAQGIIADGRATAEKMRADVLAEARTQQEEILARARRDIEQEKDKAVAELHRTAVDLAIRGAERVIEKNLDDAGNRKLVEQFLASVASSSGGAKRS